MPFGPVPPPTPRRRAPVMAALPVLAAVLALAPTLAQAPTLALATTPPATTPPAVLPAGGMPAASARLAGAPLARALPSTQEAEALSRLDAAYRLERRGDYAQAAAEYAALADVVPEAAPAALLAQARAALAERDTDTAGAALDRLLAEYPQAAEAVDARFLQALARRAGGDCAGALAAVAAFERAGGSVGLGPYPNLQRAACAGAAGDYAAQLRAADAALAADGGGPRLARVEALEQAASALLKLGRRAEALDRYNGALDLAATRGYRAEMLFNTATLARALGRNDLAVERFRAVVLDYADQARAPGALDALVEMGRQGVVSPYQAGLVRLNARDYAAARALFEQVPPGSPDAGAARFSHAVARLRSEDDSGPALADLQALAEQDRAWAGTALVRMGRVYELEGRPDQAEAAYARVPQLDPQSAQLPEALARLGVLRYGRGALDDALAALNTAVEPARKAPAPILAQAQLFRGKVLGRQQGAASAAARDAWAQATAAQPDGYYGLRAAELRAGGGQPTNPGPRPGVSFDPRPEDTAEWAAWVAARAQTTPEAMEAEVGAEPGLARAERLLALGLRDEAGWELDGLARRYAEAKDVARLVVLARWAAERDLPGQTLVIGRLARDVGGVGLLGLPRLAQQQVYPAGWGDLVTEEAARRGVDPLLLLALVRQESTFNPRAVSSARATGLTQVTPGTGAEIARRVGRGETFSNADLMRPGVSLEFGAYYLAAQLSTFGNRVLPALAAYNAGGGNAAPWARAWGEDPDLFVERVPFTETQSYLKLVYENYRLYQRVYERE